MVPIGVGDDAGPTQMGQGRLQMPLQGVHNGPWELPEDPGLAAASLNNLSRPCV